MKMRCLQLVQIRSLAPAEATIPEPGSGEIQVRVGQVGICGSDLHVYRHREIGGIQASPGWVMGHEAMGTVSALGAGVPSDLLGRRVAVEPHRPCRTCEACRRGLTNACLNDHFLGLPPVPGALCEYVVLRADQVEPLDDHISDEEGVLLEPLAIAEHAIRLVKPQPGEPVAIIGTGVLGTCVLALLKQIHGVAPVCVDLLPDRLERARDLGASAVIRAEPGQPDAAVRAIREATGGLGALRVFECAGSPETFRMSCDAAGAGAHLAIIGIPDEPVMTFPASPSRKRALTLRMVRRSWNTLAPCVAWMRDRRLNVRALATHVFPAARASEAFALADQRPAGTLKVLVDLRCW